MERFFGFDLKLIFFSFLTVYFQSVFTKGTPNPLPHVGCFDGGDPVSLNKKIFK